MKLAQSSLKPNAHLGRAASRLVTLWNQPLIAFGLTFLFYFLLAGYGRNAFVPSSYPYYNYLADAFLHGQLHLRLDPGTLHDLIPYNGRVYLYWGPLPAVLLMPFVAIFGVGFSDYFTTALFGALNVVLVNALLRAAVKRGLFSLSDFQIALMTLFFGFGTVQLILATQGWVWFVSQTIAFGAMAIAYLASIKFSGEKAFFWTGLAVGCAFATRNSIIFTAIWPAWFLIKEHWHEPWPKRLRLFATGAFPALIFLGLILLYNYARFGNPFNTGVNYHLMGEIFIPLFNKYGLFNINYLPMNLYYQFINYPLPWRDDSPYGGSLFLLSPLYFTLFLAFLKNNKKKIQIALLVTILIAYLPIGFLMGTGFVTFGPRYLQDITLPLLLLTAFGLQKLDTRISVLLASISIGHYLIGVVIGSNLFVK